MSSEPPDWLAVYRASLYAYRARPGAPADADGWRRFALDGDPAGAGDGAAALGLYRPLTLITAWNPDSVEQEAAWNAAANARLAAALAAAGVDHDASYGSSLPGTAPAWREEGFVLWGLDRAAAAAWGREWGQRALVQVAPAGACLLFCADGAAHDCGVRLLAQD